LGDLEKMAENFEKARAYWEHALRMYIQTRDLYSMRVMYNKLTTVTGGKEKKEYQKMEKELKNRLNPKKRTFFCTLELISYLQKPFAFFRKLPRL
jgi:hypothetical protein